MPKLDKDDFEYFDRKFDTIHSEFDRINSDIAAIKLESESRLNTLETKHKMSEKKKESNKIDIFKTLGIIGSYIMILVIVIL